MLERLAQLDQNVSSLETLHAENAPEAFGSSITLQWALRYGLIESIQIVIDTACEVCSKNNLGVPSSYGDCVRLLARARYLSTDCAEELVKVVGLRNLLIHEYTAIDTGRLYGFLAQLDIFRRYAKELRPYL